MDTTDTSPALKSIVHFYKTWDALPRVAGRTTPAKVWDAEEDALVSFMRR
jgi:hypothetical protein